MLAEDRDGREIDSASREARSRLRRRAEEIERAELTRALSALESQGGLTDEQRTVVVETAAAIVDGLLDDPETALRRSDDPDIAREAVALFEPDE